VTIPVAWMQPMVARAERADRRATRPGGRSNLRWIRYLTAVTLVLVVGAIGLEILRVGGMVSVWPAEVVVIAALGLTGGCSAVQP
jgi:hypothetical protein